MLVGFLYAGRISTINEGTPYSGWGFYKSSALVGSSLAILFSRMAASWYTAVPHESGTPRDEIPWLYFDGIGM
jgi:hypothetical protein